MPDVIDSPVAPPQASSAERLQVGFVLCKVHDRTSGPTESDHEAVMECCQVPFLLETPDWQGLRQFTGLACKAIAFALRSAPVRKIVDVNEGFRPAYRVHA